MTEKETIKLMAMLNAFYAGGKGDPKLQATAWHLVLGKYDYRIASQAVIHFAENDTREYANFPPVGAIVAQIKKEIVEERKPITEIVKAVCYGWRYEQLSDNAKKLISEDKYDEWLKVDAEEFASHAELLADGLRRNQLMLLGAEYGED